MKMNLSNKYFQDYNLSKKHITMNNISTEFTKTIKLLKNNINNYHNYSNKINLSNKKIFQNTKHYNIIKPSNPKIFKKRNNSYSSMHNNLTEGNLINDNSNNFISLFNSNVIKYNKRNYNTNTNFIKPNKILIKSKSNTNNGFIRKYPYQNLIINTGGKSNVNNNNINNNNKKLFYTFGIMNNISIKNIKNYTKKISNSCKKNYNNKLQINQFDI